MENKEIILFSQLAAKANAIRDLYIKAQIYQNIDKECESRRIHYFNDLGQEIIVEPEKFIVSVDTAVNSLPSNLKLMINMELLDRRNYCDYWYLETLSRSTYYRHRKEAYRRFVSYFE